MDIQESICEESGYNKNLKWMMFLFLKVHCWPAKKSAKIASDDGKLILRAIHHSCLADDMAVLGGELIWFPLQPDIVK